MKRLPIDELVALIVKEYPGAPKGYTSTQLRSIGKRYLAAHPQFTRDQRYAHDVYVTANEIYALAEGVARAEKSGRRMKRQAAAWERKKAK